LKQWQNSNFIQLKKRKHQLRRIVLPSCNWFYRCLPTIRCCRRNTSGFSVPCEPSGARSPECMSD